MMMQQCQCGTSLEEVLTSEGLSEAKKVPADLEGLFGAAPAISLAQVFMDQ